MKNTTESNIITESDLEALSFISAGVACYAFSLLDELGLIEELQSGLPYSAATSYPNPLVIQTALQTLEKNGAVFQEDGTFHFTTLGKGLLKHRGSIGLIYSGYRKLLSKQVDICLNEPSNHGNLIDSLSVSKASTYFGEDILDQMILEELKSYRCKGQLCDLGCGEGKRLAYLCTHAGFRGLGFDLSHPSIKKGRKQLEVASSIQLEVADITQIKGIYPEAEVLLQAFVMHDFSPIVCQKTLESYRHTFPNTKLFIYVDAVAPDPHSSHQLPGFDYMHSLMNIKTRTKKETLEIIRRSHFTIQSEQAIPSLPNCYIWTLTPASN